MPLPSLNVNDVWLEALSDVMTYGSIVAPRNMAIYEILNYHTVIDMSNPVLGVQERNLGYKFLCAEAAWILSGDNRVSTISPYSKNIVNFSDDGVSFFGAYGPKIRDQIPYVVDTLLDDHESRQAVINIWRESPRETKDVPCTVSLQFLIRDQRLHIISTMRSSDLWLGWPYDTFNISMVGWYVLCYMKKSTGFQDLLLGKLHLNAGSAHLYQSCWKDAKILIEKYPDNYDLHSIEDLYLDLPDGDPDDVVKYLWRAADENTFAEYY